MVHRQRRDALPDELPVDAVRSRAVIRTTALHTKMTRDASPFGTRRTVKAAFQRYSPGKVACPPKVKTRAHSISTCRHSPDTRLDGSGSQLLRSSFITYLRNSEAAPEVLKSCATQMKHLVDTRIRQSRIL